MSELLSSNDEIRESVLDALANRKVGLEFALADSIFELIATRVSNTFLPD